MPPVREALERAGLIGVLAGVVLMNARDAEPVSAAVPTPTPIATVVSTPPPAAATPDPAATVAAPATFTPDWPGGSDGWTVQLQTLPKDGTTPEAVATASQRRDSAGRGGGRRAGLRQLPIPRRRPYVIYSTVSTSKTDAEGVLDGLIANFPEAKVVEVSDRRGRGHRDEVQAGPRAEGEDADARGGAEEHARRAGEVESEGTPPPADDKKPGGGSERRRSADARAAASTSSRARAAAPGRRPRGRARRAAARREPARARVRRAAVRPRRARLRDGDPRPLPRRSARPPRRQLQTLDAELGAIERLARMDERRRRRRCPNCDALYPRGAAFCSQCAHPLMR